MQASAKKNAIIFCNNNSNFKLLYYMTYTHSQLRNTHTLRSGTHTLSDQRLTQFIGHELTHSQVLALDTVTHYQVRDSLTLRSNTHTPSHQEIARSHTLSSPGFIHYQIQDTLSSIRYNPLRLGAHTLSGQILTLTHSQTKDSHILSSGTHSQTFKSWTHTFSHSLKSRANTLRTFYCALTPFLTFNLSWGLIDRNSKIILIII